MKTALKFFVALALALPAACAFGPKTLTHTHHEYTKAVKQISEEHLLFTLLRIRYDETPANLDLSSIAAQYEISASAEARPFYGTESVSGLFRDFSKVLPFASVGGSNRPTFSYTPGDDGATIRRFLTPIGTDSLVFLTRSTRPVSIVLRLYVDRMNGVPNGFGTGGHSKTISSDHERFIRATELLDLLSEKEALTIVGGERIVEIGDALPADRVTAASQTDAAKNGLEYRKRDDGLWVLVRREPRLMVSVTPGSEGLPELVELCSVLNLEPARSSYEITVSVRGEPDPTRHPIPPGREFRLATRSNAQVLQFLSNGIEVPAQHLSGGVAADCPQGTGLTRGLLRIKSAPGHHPPAGAFVAVPFRDHWFYIEDSDTDSKRTFALTMQLTRLDFTRTPLGGPTLTLPVGR